MVQFEGQDVFSQVHVGQIIIIDNGALKLEVLELDEDEKEIICTVKNDYKLSEEKKNIRFPGSSFDCSALSDIDRNQLENFVCKNDIDFCTIPSIKRGADVEEIKELIK